MLRDATKPIEGPRAGLSAGNATRFESRVAVWNAS